MENQELLVSKVPRALEMKSKLLGYELPDLLLIFMNLALMNLIFGTSTLRYPLVWGTTLVLAVSLRVLKKGKAENYLQHLGEYIAKPAYRAAGGKDPNYRPFKRKLR